MLPERSLTRTVPGMPELPEVETLRRQLSPHLVGARILSVDVDPLGRYQPAQALTGRQVTALERRGKYLLAVLDDGREAIVHLGMTGQWWRVEPPDHVRVVLHTDRGTLWFRDSRAFGRVDVVAAGDYRAHPTLAGLGPDPLRPDFDRDAAAQQLTVGHAPVKGKLLAQAAVAGVGNYIADEALWRTAVHPATRHLDADTARRLVDACVAVMSASLAAQGMTERDFQHLDGSGGEFQFSLDCYGRAGQPCRRCGDTLTKAVVAGRGTTWCPTCQQNPGPVDEVEVEQS